MDQDTPLKTNDVERLDAIIAKDPEAQTWTFAGHERGALHEAERMMTLAGVSESDDVGITKKTGPRSITHIKRSAAAADRETKLEPGTAELCRFIRLLNLINRNCPWAPHPFEVNDAILRELTSNHLNLIVGQQNANRHGPRLRSLIGAELTPSNICWITNRQQGKTTTLSKFIAALAVGSVAGGNLCFVYSTGLDRAQEVVKVNPPSKSKSKSKSKIPNPAHQIQIQIKNPQSRPPPRSRRQGQSSTGSGQRRSLNRRGTRKSGSHATTNACTV